MRKVHSWNAQIPPGQYQRAQSPYNIRFETKPFLAFWIYVALLCSWEDTAAEIQPGPSWHSLFWLASPSEKRDSSRVQLLGEKKPFSVPGNITLEFALALGPSLSAQDYRNAILVAAHTSYFEKALHECLPNQVAIWHFFFFFLLFFMLLCACLPLKARGQPSCD